ncbi:hypothetical protein N3K66_001303 [Trichothecium roseum]|uniref:Uncharacterized protein n=1 Tax=Trichothecium roseum TaxID=47278 RepID=A0ACC0VEP8_9HYPO|nr:hypothetical protein N3K66_001303 [Trichothecium roseum]
MFRPHPEEQLHLRLHRARSVVLTSQELVEIRAAQRTFEGAYMRTALGQFSFSLVILKIFTAEFYAIGALFAVYGVAILLVAVHRRYERHRQFFTAPAPAPAPAAAGSSGAGSNGGGGAVSFPPPDIRKFRTSGDTVALLTALSLCAYVTLLVLTWRLVN